MSKFQKNLKSFEGLSEEEKVDKVTDDLEKAGIKPVITTSQCGRKMAYYIGEDTVFAAATLPEGRGVSFALFDRHIYDKYLADGSFYFVSRRNGTWKVRIRTKEYSGGIELHQLVMRDAGYDLEGKPVDHKLYHPQINTSDALRVCTDSNNRVSCRYLNYSAKRRLERSNCEDYDKELYKEITDKEKKLYGEFAYNPLMDFTNTWYGYVLYKMLKRGTIEELKDYNKDYIIRNDSVMAHYYWDILVS